VIAWAALVARRSPGCWPVLEHQSVADATYSHCYHYSSPANIRRQIRIEEPTGALLDDGSPRGHYP
jgi:hypothetical protein